jgi:hypothetical protein
MTNLRKVRSRPAHFNTGSKVPFRDFGRRALLRMMEHLVAESLRRRHVASRQGEEPFTGTGRLVNAAMRLRATPA